MSYHPPTPDPAWFRTLRVGDVIAEKSGAWRVVREITRQPDGALHSVTLTIRHCSWTHRCYTVINHADLKTRRFRRVPVRRRRLASAFDRKIRAAIHQNNHPAREPHLLTCCDVEGVA